MPATENPFSPRERRTIRDLMVRQLARQNKRTARVIYKDLWRHRGVRSYAEFSAEVYALLNELVSEGVVKVENQPTTGRGGRPTMVYSIRDLGAYHTETPSPDAIIETVEGRRDRVTIDHAEGVVWFDNAVNGKTRAYGRDAAIALHSVLTKFILGDKGSDKVIPHFTIAADGEITQNAHTSAPTTEETTA